MNYQIRNGKVHSITGKTNRQNVSGCYDCGCPLGMWMEDVATKKEVTCKNCLRCKAGKKKKSLKDPELKRHLELKEKLRGVGLQLPEDKRYGSGNGVAIYYKNRYIDFDIDQWEIVENLIDRIIKIRELIK